MVWGGFKSIDLAIAVILVFVFFLENSFFGSKLAGMFDFWIFQGFLVKNDVKSYPGINGRSGILDSIKLW